MHPFGSFCWEFIVWSTTTDIQAIYIYLLYKYRDLHSKKDRDKNSLFALEKPADWSYDFFH